MNVVIRLQKAHDLYFVDRSCSAQSCLRFRILWQPPPQPVELDSDDEEDEEKGTGSDLAVVLLRLVQAIPQLNEDVQGYVSSLATSYLSTASQLARGFRWTL